MNNTLTQSQIDAKDKLIAEGEPLSLMLFTIGQNDVAQLTKIIIESLKSATSANIDDALALADKHINIDRDLMEKYTKSFMSTGPARLTDFFLKIEKKMGPGHAYSVAAVEGRRLIQYGSDKMEDMLQAATVADRLANIQNKTVPAAPGVAATPGQPAAPTQNQVILDKIDIDKEIKDLEEAKKLLVRLGDKQVFIGEINTVIRELKKALPKPDTKKAKTAREDAYTLRVKFTKIEANEELRQGKITEMIKALKAVEETAKTQHFTPETKDKIKAAKDALIAEQTEHSVSEKARDDQVNNKLKKASEIIGTIKTNLANIETALADLEEEKREAINNNADAKTLDEVREKEEALKNARKTPLQTARANDAVKKAQKLTYDLKLENYSEGASNAWDDGKGGGMAPLELRKGGSLHGLGQSLGGIFSNSSGSLYTRGKNYLSRIWNGREGTTAQSIAKGAGGLLAAILAYKTIGSWISNNMPWGTQGILNVALFIGTLLVGAKMIEGSMDTKHAAQVSKGTTRHIPDVSLPAGYDPTNVASISDTAKTQTVAKIMIKGKGEEIKVQELAMGGSATEQPHDGGAPANEYQNFALNVTSKATAAELKLASSHATQGTNKHVDTSNISGGIALIGKGNNMPIEFAMAQDAHGNNKKMGGIESTPHGNDDEQPDKTVVQFAAVLDANQAQTPKLGVTKTTAA
ncbi:MAG: hypothetical protein DHS20C02_00660 [Micavibrio sp.]|nr:MAG: hypothetical protein DHS20C02_00660 [Micavibrio sp.]